MDAVSSDEPSEEENANKVTNIQIRKKVFERAVSLNDSSWTSKPLIFDGQDYAYSAKSVHKHWPESSTTLSVTQSFDAGNTNDALLPCLFHVTLRVQRRYDVKLLDKYCDGDNSVAEAYVQGMLYALDSIVRGCKLPDMVSVGSRQLCARNAVVPKTSDLGADLYWEYKYTVRPGRGALFVNIGQRMVPVINRKTVEALAQAYFAPILAKLADGASLASGVTEKDWRDFEAVARDLHVCVLGSTHPNLVYRVIGISKERADQMTMDGTSLALYFQEHHGVDQSQFNGRLPCLLTADNGPPIPLALGAIHQHQIMEPMARWQRATVLSLGYLAPTDRHRVLSWGAQALASSSSPALDVFGIRISPELIHIDAQLLKQPKLLMCSSKSTSKAAVDVSSRNGKWKIEHVVDGRQLTSWTVLILGCSKQAMPAPLVQAFVAQLVKVSQDIGIDVRNTGPPIKYASLSSSIEQTVAEAAELAHAHAGSKAQLVLCILPRYTVRMYGELKRVALTLVGVQTQCIVAAHVRAHNPKLLSMVALKINVKLGGTTSELSAPDSIHSLNDQQPTLVISADVSHTTESQCMSVAAILGSVDMQASRFQGIVVQHPKRMEYIENFDILVRQCLRIFYKSTGQKPKRILYYRDGVNDSQMRAVKDLELCAIYSGCRLVDPEYRPSVTMVLARKRHNARFIIQDDANDAFGNCLPGTMVGQDVTSPVVFSFYLVSHQPELGVSRPTCYYVLHDDTGFTPQALRTLTYNMCYTYPIICRSATMPAALYYAHRLSGKGRLQLNRRFDDLPFFDKENDHKKHGKKKNSKKVESLHLVPVHRNIQDSMYFM
ncbi:hypothetical protein EV178_004291 [Coemansia sp. RSA 1646]|nr:hypothetical protein EV178_004291 [Coemansia sp. RSA 1646]